MSKEFKEKVKKFVLINTVFYPISMMLGLLSSIFVIRRLGVEQYAVIAILNSFIGSVSFVLNLGIPMSITKMWIEYHDENIRKGLIVFSFIFQVSIVLLLLLLFVLSPNIIGSLLGENFLVYLPVKYIVIILASLILQSISSAFLLAELENKITSISLLVAQLFSSIWLIFISIYKINMSTVVFGLIIINLMSAIILFFGRFKFIFTIRISDIKFFLYKHLIKKYFTFFLVISVVIVFRYITSGSLILLVLNKYHLIFEVAYYSIIMKIISMITNIIEIPVNKIGTVVFLQAHKEKNINLENKTYALLTRYKIFANIFAFSFLFYFMEPFISKVYNIKPEIQYFNLFYIASIFWASISLYSFVVQIYEYHKITILSVLLSVIYIFIIFYYYTEKYGLTAILLGNIGNYLLFNVFCLLFIHFKHPYLKYPLRLLFCSFISLVFSLLLGSLVNNFIVSSSISLLLFLILFLIIYKPDKYDEMIIDEIPKKILNFVPGFVLKKFYK